MGITEDQIIEAEEGWQYGEDQQTRENFEGLTEEDPWNMMNWLSQLQSVMGKEEKKAKVKKNVNMEKGEMKKFFRKETKD